MEPLKPSERAKLLQRGTEKELGEYESLLAQRFCKDPLKQQTPEEEREYLAQERRLKELARKFYPKLYDQKPTGSIDGRID